MEKNNSNEIISVSNEIVFKKFLTESKQDENIAIAVYIVLRFFYSCGFRIFLADMSSIYYMLYGQLDENVRRMSQLFKGLEILEKYNLIKILKKFNKHNYEIDINNLFIDYQNKESYTRILLSEVRKICNIQRGTDNYNILKYYIAIISTLDFNIVYTYQNIEYTNFIGHMSIEYLSALSNVSDNTGIRFNDLLIENKILYIFSCNKYQFTCNKLHYYTNLYGRYEYKDVITSYASDIYNSINDSMGYKQNNYANMKRSATQRMNRIINGEVYPLDEIKDIYKFLSKDNANIFTRIDKETDQKKKEKLQAQIKDLSILEQIIKQNDCA